MGQVQGVRVPTNDDGWLDPKELQKPARYGRATNKRVVNSPANRWNVTAPDGTGCTLDPAIHAVTEHEDGTITVLPSIDLSGFRPGGWHGWLRQGVFHGV